MQTMAILRVFLASFTIAINVVNARNTVEELPQAATLNDDNINLARYSDDEEDHTVDRRGFVFIADVQCPRGWLKLFNKCYLFVKSQVTWDKARVACMSRGGDLAIPRSVSECNVLSLNANHLGLRKPWIGIFRRRFGNIFYNTCGKPLSFTRWASGEPNDYNGVKEGCGQILVVGSAQAHWNDAQCQSKYGYICQYQIPRCD